MSLVEEVLEKADEYGVSRDKVIREEVEYFQNTHGEHGAYKIEVDLVEGDVVDSISVRCVTTEGEECPYNDEFDLPLSIVYSRRNIQELEYQRRRREGSEVKWDFRPIDYFLNALEDKDC